MADEYIAHLNRSIHQQWRLVLDKMLHTQRYELEGSPGATMRFRYFNQPRRDVWPEDITLELDGDTVLLTIHAGTKEQRAELLDDFWKTLQELGFADATLEEA
jgi:hypothetical protein